MVKLIQNSNITRILVSNFFTYFLVIFFTCALSVIPSIAVLASTTDGTISGYAWSSQMGWINFGTTNGNTHITDSAVTGYAWNENMGRINLNPTQSGVVNTSSGTLSGKAWCEGTGWIDFTGVTVSSSGVFSGTATGDNSISINFNCTKCNVATDWRPASSRTASSSSSSASSGGGIVFGPPSGAQSITINNGSQYTNNATVHIALDGGPDATTMALSNTPNVSSPLKEGYQKTKLWVLSDHDGAKTVYVTFYTKYGVASSALSSNIFLDTTPPDITITSMKNNYTATQDVIIEGTTEPAAQVNLFIDDKYGALPADQQGNWVSNFGKMALGKHHLELFAKDLARNISKTIAVDVIVVPATKTPTEITLPPPFNIIPPFVLAPPLAPIFRQLAEGINSFIPKFFQPLKKTQPPALVTVPKITPPAFRGGLFSFHYISTTALARFVLRPLPGDIKLLAQKFPQVQKTFNEVGVTKITDLQKLSRANLKLPNLTQAVLPKSTIAVGKFATPKGIPIEKLSAAAKSSIPSEIVFAKAAGGLVDFNVALSINPQGKPVQKIQTISGQSLQLVVKPERGVKKIIGYVVFKSKKHPTLNIQPILNAMSASLLFANPQLASAVLPNVQIPIEGVNLPTETILPTAPVVPPDPSTVEQRLVLSTFEYQDSGNGVYTATVQTPVVDGEYEIITVIQYLDASEKPKEIKLITVVDPEGYIYEKNGDLETRIAGAIASLYWLNPVTKQYELWPAKDFQQENPQTTDVRGTYSFLVPDGYYYLKVDAPGYLSYDGKPFEVKEGSGIHINIQLKTKYWFLNIVDWKTLLLIVVILMLLYNFYKDKIRDRQKNNVSA